MYICEAVFVVLLNAAAAMPAKATLFNLKCEPIFDFGTGARNVVYYNPFGNNILSLKLQNSLNP